MSAGGRSASSAGWWRRGTARYRGLRHAPAFRAYCTLFGFTGGVLLITAGSVFCSVISRHPQSGGHPMHTPPLLLAVAMILLGAAMVVASVLSVWIHWLEGDEGGDSFEGEDDTQNICTSDQLDQLHREHLHQQLLFQRYIDAQLHKQQGLAGDSSSSSCCCHCQSDGIKRCESESSGGSSSSCSGCGGCHYCSDITRSRGVDTSTKHMPGCLAQQQYGNSSNSSHHSIPQHPAAQQQQQVHSAKPAPRSCVEVAPSNISRPRPHPSSSSILGVLRGCPPTPVPPTHRHASIVISDNDEISVVIGDS